jgi:TPP-dependent pyruvate/acetoin dehydrogenase alpha subunit
LPRLYEQMSRSRLFELVVAELWQTGLISGEMHLGTGEEAVAAGVVSHLRDGDGLALAHRSTPPLVVRGVPLTELLHEILGHEQGLCGGRGGHMHLLSRSHLAASSGIVGSSLPVGAGFALAARRHHQGSVGVAFTGDGALNQGMALDLAVAWSLPMLAVCIDNGWAITTRSSEVTGGDLRERARSFGWVVDDVDGSDVLAVDRSASRAIRQLREGAGPRFIYARCPRLDGHFLGDPLVRQARSLTGGEARATLGRVLRSSGTSGAGVLARAESLARMIGAMRKARFAPEREGREDPLRKARSAMKRYSPRLTEEIERRVEEEVTSVVQNVLPDGSR